MPMVAPRTPGVPATGTFGVGGVVGVGVGPAATSQTQFVLAVQDGLRQTFPVQVNPDAQSLVAAQLLLQLAFAG